MYEWENYSHQPISDRLTKDKDDDISNTHAGWNSSFKQTVCWIFHRRALLLEVSLNWSIFNQSINQS